MFAHTGDHIHLLGRHQGDRERDGEVIEVRGEGGQPPYLVRWIDNGQTGLVYPGTDAVIEHAPEDR